MKDLAWQLLQPALQQQGNGQALWLVDENITEQDIASITPAKNLQVISNRYDVYLALQKKVLRRPYQIMIFPVSS